MSKAINLVRLSQYFDVSGNLLFPKSISVGQVLQVSSGLGNGIAFTPNAFGGSGDTATITLQNPTGGENTEMTFKMTNDNGDIFRFDAPSINGIKYKTFNIMHQGNGGPGTGFDADLLDGFQSSVLNAINTVPVRDSNGVVNAFSFRSTDTVVNTGIQFAMVKTTGDNTYKSASKDAFKAFLGIQNINANPPPANPTPGGDFALNDGITTNGELFTTFGNSNGVRIKGNAPTITFQDTDGMSGYWHVNSNKMFLLRGGINAGAGQWSQINNQWPVIFDLANNSATFGGAVLINGFTNILSSLAVSLNLGVTGSASIAGGLTISSGSVILNGTGRIQGVDTVTDNTDAANKLYVDTKFEEAIQQIQANQGNIQFFTTPGTVNYTVPAGVTRIKATVIGGGSGGGRILVTSSGGEFPTTTTTPFPGSYGGVAIGSYNVTPGQVIAITVGAGGAGTGASSFGSNGGTSSFGSFCSSTGGGSGVNGVGSGGNIRNASGGNSITFYNPSNGTFSNSGNTAPVTFNQADPNSWAGAAGRSGSNSGTGGAGGAVILEI